MPAHRNASFFGVVFVFGIFLISGVVVVKNAFEVWASNLTSQVTVSNSLPIVSAVVLNNGNSITLTGNATTTVRVNFTVTEQNGCNDVYASGSLQTTLFRAGVSGGSSCATSTLNCYRVSTTTQHSCTANATTTLATSTFEVYYFADATDASSSYPAEDWVAYVLATDGSNATGSATSTHREINTLTAINLSTSSINYGAVSANTDTGATNQTVSTQNAGNSSTTLTLNAQATLKSGSNVIATTSQHYATSTFTYGGSEQSLQEGATQVAGFNIVRPAMDARWATTTNSPGFSSVDAPIAVNNGYIYRIGGNLEGEASTSVYFAPINGNGSIGTWASTTPMSVPKYRHVAVAYKNFLYAIAGYDVSGGSTSSIYYAPINTNGSLGSWLSATPLLSGIVDHKSLAPGNDFLYVVGGTVVEGGIPTSTVFYAAINSTGSLGSWATTTPLPQVREEHGAAFWNGFMYVTGGRTDIEGALLSTVYYAPINSNGTLGSWTESNNAMPEGRIRHANFANNGILYIAGGNAVNVTLPTSTSVFSPIHQNGSIGSWSSGPSLSYPVYLLVGDAFGNGYAYIVRGTNDAGNIATSSFISLSSRDTFWGLSVPGGTPTGTYTGTNVFSQTFQP